MNILDWLVGRFGWRIPDDLDLAENERARVLADARRIYMFDLTDEERAAKIRSRYAWNRNPDTTVYAAVCRDFPTYQPSPCWPLDTIHPAALRPHPCPRCRRFSARSWTASDALGDRRGGVCAVHGEWEAA